MNCMNCSSPVTRGTEYCPKCGFHVLSQKKAIYLSKLYYNQGLEKASVRDLSGAISCLKQSLKFNKMNIQARNLLGLVYFETGEVVAALCEWVISKNMMPSGNLASTYIDRLQANPSKLEVINRTVNQYNLALSYCNQGNEDIAEIQLRKLLSQNPHLIKGYHLLALLQIKEEAYSKARRTLKRALKIDRTNTTTLRFLHEVDEQTGRTTDLNGKTRKKRNEESRVEGHSRVFWSGNDLVILPPIFRENSMAGFFLNLGLGILIGVVAVWFLVVPAKTQEAYNTVNQQLLDSGDTISGQNAQITQLQEDYQEAQQEITDAKNQTSEAESKLSSMENLMMAYRYMNAGAYESAAEYLKNVTESDLSEDGKNLYQTVFATVGSYSTSYSDSGEDDYDDSYGDDYDYDYDDDYDY